MLRSSAVRRAIHHGPCWRILAAALLLPLSACSGGKQDVETPQPKPGAGDSAGAGDKTYGPQAGSASGHDAANGNAARSGAKPQDNPASARGPTAGAGDATTTAAGAIGGTTADVTGSPASRTPPPSATTAGKPGANPTVLPPTNLGGPAAKGADGNAADQPATTAANAALVGTWTGLQDAVPPASGLTLKTTASQVPAAPTAQTTGQPLPSTGAKKGLGMWGTAGKEGARVGAHWYYNWAPTPNMGDSGTLEHVPMIWGGKHANAGSYAAAKAAASPYLLGPNEPDKSGSEASGMSPEAVIAIWPELMRTGKKLGSPAVAGDYKWLARFMEMAKQKSYRVDFIAVHHYPNAAASDAVDKLRQLLTDLHQQYDRPIWLTEFGFCTWSTASSVAEGTRQAFMVKVLAMLDSLRFVERYAWFSDKSYPSCDMSAIYDASGNLTATGRAYSGK